MELKVGVYDNTMSYEKREELMTPDSSLTKVILTKDNYKTCLDSFLDFEQATQVRFVIIFIFIIMMIHQLNH